MERQENYAIVDVFKMICAILVIEIHTRPFSTISHIVDFYLTDVIARVAVPFFYATAGYFFFSKLEICGDKIRSSKENRTVVKKYLLRIARLYCVWSAIYLLWQVPYWKSIDWTGKNAIVDYFVSFFLDGSVYHFWYIVCLLYGIIITFILATYLKIRVVRIISFVLYMIKCLIYSYSWIGLPGVDFLSILYNKFPCLFDTFGLAIPFMLAGFFPVQKEQRENSKVKRNDLYKLCLCAVFLIVEASLLFFASPNNNNFSYIFMSLPQCYCIVKSLIWIKPMSMWASIQKKMRRSSTIVYCVHPLVIYLIEALIKIQNNILKFGMAVCLSVLIALSVLHFENGKISKLLY